MCHDVQMFFWRVCDVEVLSFWERICNVHTPAVGLLGPEGVTNGSYANQTTRLRVGVELDIPRSLFKTLDGVMLAPFRRTAFDQ